MYQVGQSCAAPPFVPQFDARRHSPAHFGSSYPAFRTNGMATPAREEGSNATAPASRRRRRDGGSSWSERRCAAGCRSSCSPGRSNRSVPLFPPKCAPPHLEVASRHRSPRLSLRGGNCLRRLCRAASVARSRRRSGRPPSILLHPISIQGVQRRKEVGCDISQLVWHQTGPPWVVGNCRVSMYEPRGSIGLDGSDCKCQPTTSSVTRGGSLGQSPFVTPE
jgi:hypothetical protein